MFYDKGYFSLCNFISLWCINNFEKYFRLKCTAWFILNILHFCVVRDQKTVEYKLSNNINLPRDTEIQGNVIYNH